MSGPPDATRSTPPTTRPLRHSARVPPLSNGHNHSTAPDRCACSGAPPTHCPRRRAGSARSRSARCARGFRGSRSTACCNRHSTPAHACTRHPPATAACGYARERPWASPAAPTWTTCSISCPVSPADSPRFSSPMRFPPYPPSAATTLPLQSPPARPRRSSPTVLGCSAAANCSKGSAQGVRALSSDPQAS